MDGEVKKIVF